MNESPGIRSIGIDAIFQYTGAGVQLFSGTIFYIIITRLFSTTVVGAIALFVAIIGMFNILFQFGLGNAAQHFTSFHLGRGDVGSARKVIQKIVAFGFILSLIGFAFLFVLSSTISFAFLHSTAYTPFVRLLSIVVLGNILFGVLNGSLLGMQNFRLSAIINVIIWISYYFGAILLATFVRDLDQIIIGWIIGISSGVLLELVFVLKSISGYSGGSRGTGGNVIFAYSLPILLSSIIGYGASYADRFVVAGLMNLSQLGVYNLSLLIATSIGFIAAPFNNILLPKFSEWYGKGMKSAIRENFRASSLLLSALFVPAALGIASLSGVLIRLLAGTGYLPGEIPLDIIIVAGAAFVVQNIAIQALASIRMTKLFILSGSVSLGANILISYMLIPYLGTIGAAIGFVSVYASTFAILFYFARKYEVAKLDIPGTVKVWIASGIMFAAVHFMVVLFSYSEIMLPVYILFGTAVFLLSARYIKVFSGEDRELIMSLFPVRNSKIRKIIGVMIRG